MRLLIVPAAGRGARLGSVRPKALAAVNGRPMLDHVVDLYREYVDRIVVVAHPSFSAEIAARERSAPLDVVEQSEPTGMLDAVLLADPVVSRLGPEWIWITWCDQIGVLTATLDRLVAETMLSGPALVFPTVRQLNPYIHFQRDASGRIVRVLHRREGDAMPTEGESDMGLFALTRGAFENDLHEYSHDAATGGGTGERNFLPFIPWLASRTAVVTFPCTDPMEALGVNTPEDLRTMEARLRERQG